jgi:hypothetical protein
MNTLRLTRVALAKLLAVSACFVSLNAAAASICPGNVGPTITPTSSFVVSNVGVVKDLTTGLMWKQCVQGLSGSSCSVGSATAVNWASALSGAVTNRFAGFSDWRLPNKRELESIIDNSCHTPAINTEVFPENGVFIGVNESTWTSTTVHGTPNFAITVGFKFGAVDSEAKTGVNLVRLVRGGPIFDGLATNGLPFCSLDINGDGAITADEDAVLLLRYLMGFRGGRLVANITLGAGRPDAQAVQSFIGNALQFNVFTRVTAQASTSALNDGIVLTRLMLGMPDGALLQNVDVPANAGFSTGFAVRTNINERCGTNF